MITFKEFIKITEGEGGLWGAIPGNPAFGGKKPSDGPGGKNNTMSSNQTGSSSQPAAGPMMMKKKMKKK